MIKGDYVVLLHGLARTSFSMLRLARFLKRQGYEVINLNYPSRKKVIEKLAEQNLKEALEKNCTDRNKKINFVTHSMGGIILRYFLANNKLPNLHRVVMLSPPNQGSEIADFFRKYKIARYIMGKQPLSLLDKKIFSGPNDGIVAVHKGKTKNMQDFLVLPALHSLIMNQRKVLTATSNFLKFGKFHTP